MEYGYEGYTASNMVMVSIDGYDNMEMRGRLYHFYVDEPDGKAFVGVIGLIKIMDEFFDTIKMPMRSMEERVFVRKKEEEKKGGEQKKGPAEKEECQPLHKQEVKSMAIKPGERATFVIHVCYRQNASWQGTVLWADEKKKVNFRSALELIKLMDNALNEMGAEEVPKNVAHGAAAQA